MHSFIYIFIHLFNQYVKATLLGIGNVFTFEWSAIPKRYRAIVNGVTLEQKGPIK